MRHLRIAFIAAFFLGGVITAFGQTNVIQVGPNVHVSRAQQKLLMREVLVSADPTDPNHLLGCGIAYDETQNREWTVAYVSTDAGKSWHPTLESNDFNMSGDPACALGSDGLAGHAFMAMPDNFRGGKDEYVLRVYRSTNGGQSWAEPVDLPMRFQGIDRESMTIDTVSRKYKNRMYISGTSHSRDLEGGSKNAFAVWSSRDGGKTFDGLAKRADASTHYVLDTGNSVVLSDGTLVSVFGDLRSSDGKGVIDSTPEQSNAVLLATRTTGGGITLSEAVKIDDFYMINIWAKQGPPPSHSGPQVAVDPGEGPFKDRLYVTWSDNRDGRGAIRFSYSSDKGKTWARSFVIDDVIGTEKNGPENFQPTVAVNKDGVVLVTWYDRRNNPDGLGWHIQARASFDGGETWTPSVRVSEAANVFSSSTKLFVWAAAQSPTAGENLSGEGDEAADEQAPKNPGPTHVSVRLNSRQFFAGDYSGLAASADGTFHAFWIDNRTGVPQIWTAALLVKGKAVRNGDAALANLEDVSSEVELKIVGNEYDRATNSVALSLRIRNTSNRIIQGPLRLRVVNTTSPAGPLLVANSDNHVQQTGALWECSALLKNNVLKPGETSEVKRLAFHLDRPLELIESGKMHQNVLDFDVRVLAGAAIAPVDRPQPQEKAAQ